MPKCVLPSRATATLEGLERLKERLHLLYIEQLCERPRPSGRTPQSWDNILSTYRIAVEHHLATLSSVQEVWCHAERCLKKDHLKEAFRHFGFEDVIETAVPQSLQEASLRPSEESASFERDLLAGSVDLSELLCDSPSTSDCLSSVAPASSFSISLKPSTDQPIDLD